MTPIPKVPINSLASGFRSSNRLNDNFDDISTAFENTLSRDGTGPNQMEASLDMNSNRVINLPAPSGYSEPIRLQDLLDATLTPPQINGLAVTGLTNVPTTVLYAPGNYPITVNTTINQSILMLPGAYFTISVGVVLTITGTVSAPLDNIFRGLGTVVLAGMSVTFPEWWGAVKASTGAATTNVAAIRAADAALTTGTVLLGSGVYYVNDEVGPTRSYMALQGQGSNQTQVINTSLTTNTLRIKGPGTGTQIDGCKIVGLATNRTVTPTLPTFNSVNSDGTWIGPKGVLHYWCANSVLDDVVPAGDYVGFYSYATTGARLTGTRAICTYVDAAKRWFGYVQDGSGTAPAGTSANGSLKMINPLAIGSTVTNTTGFYSFGDIRDQWFENPETLTKHGITMTGGSQDFDVNLINPVVDSFLGTGISITGLSQSGTISIIGGWTNPAVGATGPNMHLETRSFTITGHEYFGGGNHAVQTAIEAVGVLDTTITSCLFKNIQIGVSLLNSSVTTVSGNSFYNITSQPGNAAIQLTNTSRCTFGNNTISGADSNSWAYGIRLVDALSDFNSFSGNAFNVGAITSSRSLYINGALIAAQGKLGATNNYVFGPLN